MILILARHAIAEEKVIVCGKVIGDDQRSLTKKGIQKQIKANKFLKKKLKKIDGIITSPLTRAKQTADLIENEFSGTPIIETDLLLPAADVKDTLAWLKKNTGKINRVILVGHEPHLSRLASFLMCGKSEISLQIKKSGIIILEIRDLKSFEPGEAILLSLVSPGPLKNE